jgi:PAS domain S-box-containing protein
MLLRAPPMRPDRAVTTISLRSHLLLLVAATLPLGALTTILLMSADSRQPEWLIAGAALLLVALGLGVTVARRIADVASAVTGAARAIGLGEVPALGPVPIRELDELARAVASAGHTRRETETRLRAAEARLAATLEAAPVAIMCIDGYRRVLVFNRAAETMFNCPATEAIGGAVDRFFSQGFLRVIEAHLENGRGRLRATTVAGADNHVGFRGDGTEFTLDAAVSRVDGPAGPVCTVVLRDVTEVMRREAERADALRTEQAARTEAEQAAQQSALLAEASRMLTASSDYPTTLTALARLVAGTLADWCVIDLVSDDGELRRLAVAHVDPAREQVAQALQARPLTRADVPEALAQVLGGGPAELIAQVTDAERGRLLRGEEQERLAEGLGLHSAMLLPLVSRGHVVGALTLARGAGEPYVAADLAAAEELAARAAAAIDHNRQYRRVQEAHARFAGLVDGLAAIVWEAEPDTLELTFVNHRAESLLGYPLRQWLGDPAFWTRLIHPDDRDATLRCLREQAAAGHECRLEYRMAAADGRLVWFNNVVQPVVREGGGVSQLRGLMIDITDRKRLAEERDRLLAAEQVARADAEAAAERARFLAEASQLLSSSLDRSATLDSLVRLAVPAFADWCLVHLVEPVAGRRLHAAGADADGARVAEAVERLAPSLELPGLLPYLEKMKEGEPLLVPDIGPAWLESLQLLQQLAPRSIMVVPLLARGRTVGTLSFITTRSERRYGPADLALARDLAHRAAIAVDNARLYAEAEGANRAKDQFLATLSHELRTPLTAMLGWVLMLRSGRLSADEATGALASIERNTRVQAQLINDLLDVSRIVAGKLQIDKRPVDLRVVIEHALDSVRRETEGRRHTVTCTIDPEAAWVSGDAVRLEQIVVNLLDNAVKFTPDDGRIDVRLDRHDGLGRITVSDSGQGIEPTMLPLIFESFRQADSSSTRRHGGLGLGLAIVRRLVALHGGRVEATSAGRGQGASFAVHLPLLALEARPLLPVVEPEVRPAREDAVLPRLDRVRALVVDDHEDSRRFVKTVLVDSGAEVLEADSVDAALEVLGRTYIDVLVSDIGMPGADGYDLISRVRELEREHGGRIPAVALTAYAGEDNRDRALGAGFTAHVTKPVSPARLVRIVAQAIGRPALL